MFRPTTQQRPYLIGIMVLIIVYIVMRLYQLTLLPPFVDEAIHIQWARATLGGEWLAGAWDGKWLSIKIMALFVSLPIEPLMAARIGTVLTGVGTLAACILIGKTLFGIREGLIAGVIYSALPYTFFYDRLALTDGYQTLFGAWTILVSILLAHSPKRRYIVLLAATMGGAVLAKLTAFIFVGIPIVAAILLSPREKWRGKFLRILPALMMVATIVGVLFWRGFAHQLTEKAADSSSVPLLSLLVINLQTAAGWYWALLTPPMMILSVLAIVWLGLVKRQREHWFLIVTVGIGSIPFLVGASIWFPRYLLFTIVPLSLLVSRFIIAVVEQASTYIKDKSISQGIAFLAGGLLLIWPLALNISLVSDPIAAALPDVDRIGFITGWTSGYGTADVARYLSEEAATQADGINVLRLYYWDQPYQGLDLYLQPSSSIHIYTLDPTAPDLIAQVRGIAETRPTFFVNNPRDETLADFEILRDELESMSRILVQPRPGGESGLEIWQMSPTDEV